MPIAPEPVPEYAAWRRGVAGVLAKTRGIPAESAGAEPEKLLEASTYDGLGIAPLYTRRDELPEQPLPGSFPYVRGGTSSGGWFVSEYFPGGQAQEVNRDILASLENGASAVWLRVGPGGVAVTELRTALAGVLLDLAPLSLDAGGQVNAAAQELFTMLDEHPAVTPAQVQLALGADPLTRRFTGADVLDLSEVVELARRATSRPEQIRAITVDGRVFHDAGAGDAQELGAAVAAGLAYIRTLGAEIGLAAALRHLEFRFSATDDQFATIAKFRAARLLWARIAQVCGVPEAGAAPQHAVTSAAMLTRRDPWVNLLRTTLAAFGAGIGGADLVTVLPFDIGLPPGELEVTPAFSQRMARNTQLLLLEEARLGQVHDPGAGSWYVEDLTTRMAATAWEFMQEIEVAGGYLAALESGFLAERIAATATWRTADIAHRRTAVTGVNEFPNLAEPPLSAAARAVAPRGYGAAFERLRDRSDAYLAATGARPSALLVPLGSVAEHNVRTSFATNLLASGGIEAHYPGPLELGALGAAASEAQARIAVICGTDTRYAAEAATAVRHVRAAGIDTVLLAGPQQSMPEVSDQERPDGFLTMQIDAVATLAGLLDQVGAS